MKSSWLDTTRLTTALAMMLSPLGSASAQALPPNPAALAATQTVALQHDADGDGRADPGDTLRYTAVVSNTGGQSAQGVTFAETLDANATLAGPVQASPLAITDVYTASNASPLVISAGSGLLANDFGLPAPTATSASSASTTQGGSVTIATDGAFTYTAPVGFAGVDSFSYTASNALSSDAGSVTVQVYTLPVAQADSYATLLETPLTVAANGVLGNDALSGGSITAYAPASSHGGSVSLSADGGFTYNPPTGFTGGDAFTYTLGNPVGSSTAVVSITVDLPGPPVATGDVYTATANNDLVVPAAGVLANDTRSGAVIDDYAATTTEGGSVSLAASGAFTYTPPTDFVSPPTDTFTYTLRNALGASTATVTLTVIPAGAPIAVDDAFTVTANLTNTVSAVSGLLANDTLNLATIGAYTTSTTLGGLAVIHADGGFAYVPPADTISPPTDSFTYTLTNALGSSSATATLTINPPAAPTLVDDAYTATADTDLVVAAASGVLDNDTLQYGTLTTYTVATARGGSVDLAATGAFTYTPPAGVISPPADTFSYTVSNALGSDTATVAITIDPPGAPIAVGEAYTATANTDLVVGAPGGVLANDTVNYGTITAFAATTARGGSVDLSPTGTFTYTPPADTISPPTDSFTYTLTNSLGHDTATVTITIDPPSAPDAVADAYTAVVDTDLVVNAASGLLDNDDPQFATISAYAASTTRGGSVVVAATGAFTYTPPAGVVSPPTDTFTYTLTNPLGSDTATATITINPAAAPSLNDDTYTATADTDLFVAAASGVLDNDTAHYGTIVGYSASTTRGGSVVLAASGAFTYTPPAGVVSPPTDSFTYTVQNVLGDDTATATITINPPGAPLTTGDAYTTTANTDLIVAAGSGLFANDTLRYGGLAGYAATTVRGGSVVVAPSGAFTYTPPVDTVSLPTDSFTYTVTNTLGSSVGTVTLTIEPPDVPTATNDAYTAVANTPLTVAAGSGVIVNDTLNFATLTGHATSTALGGSVAMDATGAFTYTPPVDTVSPPTDSFTYTLGNLLGSSTGTVTLTINPPAPPTAAGESYTATVNVPLTVAAPGVLANDTVNFGTIVAYDTTSANGGSVALAPTGAFTYTSAHDTLGVDTFTYTLTNTLGSSTGTVTVTVYPPPPDAVNDAYTTTGNVDLAVAVGSGVLGNDTLNWGTLSASATTSAQGGTVAVNANGSFTYNPPTGFTGTDTFTYTVSNALTSDTATVSVTVSQRVWFVDNTAAAGGTGRHSAPFDTLAEAEAASSANDYIYVYYGDGTSTGQNAGITLKAGQRLFGQHMALVVNSTTIEAAAPGNRPLIVAGSGNAVTAPTAAGVEVRGLRLTSGASGDALGLTTSGSANAGLTISDNIFTAPSNSGVDIAQNGSGILTLSLSNNTFSGGAPALRITRSAGTAYVTDFSNLVVDGAAADAVQLSNVIFDATPGGSYNVVSGGTAALGVSGNPVDGPGLTLTNVSGDLAFTDLDIYATSAALNGSGSGSFATNSGLRLTTGAGVSTFSASGGPAVALSAATLDLQLSTLTSTGSSTTGVSLTNIDGTFTAGSGSTITNATGTDFYVSGGSGTITYSGTVANTSGASVSISNRTGGTVSFGGAISDTGSGVSLSSNTGATIAFSGGLTLNTGANTAFSATGGGTVTVTGSTNTLATTTGTALNVVNTTIGAAGLTFRSIASNGAVSGIVLNNTGSSGGLTVSGTGSAGSGGTIQNSTTTGVSLTSARDIYLNYMTVSGSGDDGLHATTVTTVTIAQSTFSANGNAVTDEGLEFDDPAGTLTLNTVTATGSAHNNVYVDLSTGTLSALTVTNGSYSSTGTTYGAHGILVTARNAATITALSITGASFIDDYGSGVFIDAADTATISSAQVSSSTFNRSVNTLGNGVTLSQSGSATLNGSVLNNNLQSAVAHAIDVFSSGTATGGTLNARVTGNTIGTAGTASSGSATGNGIRVRIQAQTNGQVLIDNNVIRQTPAARGIEVVGGSDSLDATITNNTVQTDATPGSSYAAIYVNASNPTGSQNGSVRADVRGNTVPAGTDSLDTSGRYLVLREFSSTTLQLVNTTAAADATNQLTNANTGSAIATAASGAVDLIAGPIGLPPLLAADGEGPGAETVTAEQLEGVLAAALKMWAAAGADVRSLDAVRVFVTDLPGARLAEADETSMAIHVDADAAGWGWFVDATPNDASEFAVGSVDAVDRVDALTVLAHELGHLLGHDHADDGLMADRLERGVRQAPQVEFEGATSGSLSVAIGVLPAGRSVTIVFDVVVANPVTGGAASISQHGTVTASNAGTTSTDDPATPTVGDANVTVLDVGRALYLPALLRLYAARADLSVAVSLSPNKAGYSTTEPVLITVVVTNLGGTAADHFWVDAYLNPSSPPTQANQLWNERCGLQPCYGLAWYVTEPLAPGASLTLTSAPGGPYADNTRWPGHFAAGTTDVYVYADSYSDDGGPAGHVPEENETNNRAELHGLSVTGDAPAEVITSTNLPAR